MMRSNAIFLVIVFWFHISGCRDTGAETVAKGCLGIAAGAALVGAAAMVANYFFQPSDRQQYENAVAFYNQLTVRYSQDLDFFVNRFGIMHFSFYEKQRVINLCNEDFLNTVGWNEWEKGAQVSSFPSRVEQDAILLCDYVSDLTKRVNHLKSKQYPSHDEVDLIHMIDNFLGTISYPSELLMLFAEYCKKYASYFSLSDIGWSLFAQYEVELTIIDRCRHDPYQLMYNLHDIIANKQSANCYGSDCRYPYIRYVNLLDSNLAQLDSVRNKVSYLYPIRVSWIDTVLIPQLRWLRTTLDPYFQSELLYRRQVQLDEEIQMLRLKRTLGEIAALEAQRAQIEYEYGNAVKQLVICIH